MKLEDRENDNWLVGGAVAFVFILLVKYFWPNSIPFEIFQFWKKINVWEGVIASWPIFLWGAGVTVIHSLLTINSAYENGNAERFLIGNMALSAFAGVFEELIFRWIFFLSAIVGVNISNFIFFGLTEWLHLNVFGQIVDFLTLGKMTWLIFGMGWSVGAAALVANAKFRKGHAYLGIFGYFNSWIIGFFLFWVMFEYGLLAAIIVHFLYDIFIDIVRYVDCVIERSLGLGRKKVWL